MSGGRRRVRWRLGCLALAGLSVALVANECLVRPLLNPLRRSPAVIERDLLGRTPLGMPRAEVEAWVGTQGWRRGGWPYPLDTEWPVQRVVGEYSSFGFRVVVFAEWAFGPDGRLETVTVYKWVADAP